jgi:hypothetical protein
MIDGTVEKTIEYILLRNSEGSLRNRKAFPAEVVLSSSASSSVG